MIVLSITRGGGGRILRKAVTSSLRLFPPVFSVAFPFHRRSLPLSDELRTAETLPVSISPYIYSPVFLEFRFRLLNASVMVTLFHSGENRTKCAYRAEKVYIFRVFIERITTQGQKVFCALVSRYLSIAERSGWPSA